MQADSESMSIIECNDEASWYLKYYYKPTENTLALFYNDGSVKDSSNNNISLTTYGTMEWRETGYKDRKYLYTNWSSGFYGNVNWTYTGDKTLSCWLLCNNTSGWREAFAIGTWNSNGVINLWKSNTYTDAWAAFNNGGWNDIYSRQTVNTTTWYNIILVIIWTTYTMYVNGVQTNTWSITGINYNDIVQVWSRQRGSNNENWIWWIWECIYENVGWTYEKVQTYVSKSKVNYWL